MKNSLLIFLLICCPVLAAKAQPAEQKTPAPANEQLSPALQEAAKLNAEAVNLFSQKRFAEALPPAQKAAAIREKQLGKTHLAVAQSYWNLGNIQSRIGKKKEAEDSFEKAFDVYEKNQPLPATDEKNFHRLMEMLAFKNAVAGSFEKAEAKFQRARELSEKIYGAGALETANALSNLGDLYLVIGDYEKAAPPLLRAYEIKVQKTGVRSDAAEITFQDVSCVLTKLNRRAELAEIEKKYELQQAAEPDPVIDSGVINGRALRLAQPIYPARAKEKRVSGTVEVHVLIDQEGKVLRACAVAGARELHRASEAAAYASRFSPTSIQGQPVRVTGVIVYNFVMR